MKSDTEIRDAVMRALSADPSLEPERIGVSVEKAVVTLGGRVRDVLQKIDAEKCTWGINGVKGLVSQLEVELLQENRRTDADIAKAIHHAFEWHALVPKTVHATTEHGFVLLKGYVQWNFQKKAAEKAIRSIKGILGIKNRIKINPVPTIEDVRDSIRKALLRSAEADAKTVTIAVKDKKVILNGTVKTVSARKEATWAAWATPGVKDVETHISLF